MVFPSTIQPATGTAGFPSGGVPTQAIYQSYIQAGYSPEQAQAYAQQASSGQGAGGFGLGTQGYVPAQLLQALFPYLTYGSDMAGQMAINQGQNATSMYNTQVDAAARAQAAQASAQAQMAAAQIAAQGGYAQQQLQSGTQSAIAQAQIQSDIIRAAGGDRNAAARLDSANKLQAGIANQGQYSKLIDAATSTGLRDQLFARNFMRGGEQPAFGSALGIIGQPKWVEAPTTQYYDYGQAPTINAPSGSMPQFSIPNLDFGSTSMPSMPSGGSDVGSIFSGYQSMLQGLLGGFGINYGEGTPVSEADRLRALAAAPPVAGYGPGSPGYNNDAQWSTGIAGQGTYIGAATGAQVLSRNYGYIQNGKGDTVPLRPGATIQMVKGEQGPEVDTLKVNAQGQPVYAGTAPNGTNPMMGAAEGANVHDGYSSIQPISPSTSTGGDFGTTTSTHSGPSAITGTTGATGTDSTASPTGGTSPEVKIGADGSIKIGGSINPQPNATSTGKEIMNLPALQAYFQNTSPTYKGTQTFNLPEYGLQNLPGPAMLSKLLNPATSTINPQERNDWMTLLGAGGYAPEVVQDIVQRFTPGYRRPQAAVGF